MKHAAHIATLLLAGAMVGAILSGCAGTRIKRISGADFLAHAEYIEALHSFDWMTYIGHSKQRAYLEYGHPAFLGSGTRTTLFWTPLSDLPEDTAHDLKAGNPPWTPCHLKLGKTEKTSASTATNQPVPLRVTD